MTTRMLTTAATHERSAILAMYAGLAFTWLVLAYLLTTGLHQRSVGFGLGVSPLDYAVTECRALVLYVKLALWPSPLGTVRAR